MPVAAIALRVRTWARSNRTRIVVLTLLIGVMSGAVMAIAGGARRTATAPDRYTERAGGDPELLVFQPSGPPLIGQIRSLPGVVDATGISFVTAFPFDLGQIEVDPNPFAGDDSFAGSQVVQGRFTDPSAPDEFTANEQFVDLSGVEVGSSVTFAAFDQEQADRNGFGEQPSVPEFEATLVGITRTPADFDDPSPSIIFSSAFLAARPDVGVIATIIEVRTSPGIEPAKVVEAARNLPGGEQLFTESAAIVTPDSYRAVGLMANGLWVVAVIAGIGAAFVISQLVGRTVGGWGQDRDGLLAVGWRRQEMLAEVIVESVCLALPASLLAALVQVSGSTFFPPGSMTLFEPDPGRSIDWLVVGVGATLTVAVSVGAAASSVFADGRAARTVRRSALVGRAARVGAPMPVVTGVRFAVAPGEHGRTQVRQLVTGALLFAGLLASLTVGLSLERLADEPPRWGADYDQLYGNPFIPATQDIVSPAAADPDVAELTAATTGSLSIDGHEVGVFAYEAIRGTVTPVVLDGRAPAALDEIALGRGTARRLSVGLDSTVEATSPDGSTVDLLVVGLTATPSDAGDGAAMSFEGFSALVPDATRNLILVRFTPDAGPDAAARVGTITANPPELFTLPRSVAALDRVTPAVFLLAGLLVVLATIALAHRLLGSARHRAREVAILRALGARRPQIRSTFHWEATVIGLMVVAAGMPLGLLAGRTVFVSIADAIGVVNEPAIAPTTVVGTAALVIVVANVVVIAAARRAVRRRTVDLLRA